MATHPRAGTPAQPGDLVEVEKLLAAYHDQHPDPAVAEAHGALVIVDRHWLLLSALLRRYGHGEERFQRVIDDHQHIIHSIERRDAAAAAALMGAHIEKAKNNLLRRASDNLARSGGADGEADAEEGWAKWRTAL